MPTAPDSPPVAAPAPSADGAPTDAGPHVARAVGWAIYVPAPPELPPGAEVVGYEVFADAAPASAARVTGLVAQVGRVMPTAPGTPAADA